MNTRIYSDLATGLVLLAASVIYYVMSLDIRDVGLGKVGPAFIPQIIAVLTFILSLILVVQSLFKVALVWRAATADAQAHTSQVAAWDADLATGQLGDADDLPEVAERNDYVTVFASSVLLVAYVLTLNFLGFVVATASYLFLQFNAGAPQGKRAMKYQALYLLGSIVAAVFINWAFRTGFDVLLPEGILA